MHFGNVATTRLAKVMVKVGYEDSDWFENCITFIIGSLARLEKNWYIFTRIPKGKFVITLIIND